MIRGWSTRGALLGAVALLTQFCAGVEAADPAKAEVVSAKKIWDQAPHNAFTDLIRFKNEWFCVFREGKAHVSPDGALRVLASLDGAKWNSVALITSPTADLRDAKIAITPDGQLMLSGAGALHQPAAATHQTMAWFSKDGRDWSQPTPIGDPNVWLWGVTWHKDNAYSVGYSTNKERFIRLYRSSDGKKFDPLVPTLLDNGYNNESSLVFAPDGTGYCLLRRDEAPLSGLLGTAKAPYTQWEWKPVGARIGGPKMIRLPDGRYFATVRLYDGKVRTSFCSVDVGSGRLTELAALPSGGDTSYAGMVLHGGLVWISYYSSHEGKTNIYLAKVKPPAP